MAGINSKTIDKIPIPTLFANINTISAISAISKTHDIIDKTIAILPFLLSFNLYFFFEPGLCYYISFSNIFPIIVVLLKYNEEKMQIELGENDKYCDYGYN